MPTRMDTSMRISVCVPVHNMENGDYFFKRLTHSLEEQTFKDFELVVTDKGKMAENTNAAIKQAKGDIIKILYMDDFLFSKDALQHIADAYKTHTGWLASACVHTEDGEAFFNPHKSSYYHNIRSGANTIGSPSVVAFENDDPLLFDENMTWLLDCDLYYRLHQRYGPPYIVDTLDVAIGIHEGQMTHKLSNKEKLQEEDYLTQKYAR